MVRKKETFSQTAANSRRDHIAPRQYIEISGYRYIDKIGGAKKSPGEPGL
ncbi:hypothetical protein IJG44_05800 [bacterium]|nr:hypothetical protein [bacterium]